MKRRAWILAFFLVVVLVISIFNKTIILSLAKWQIGHVFKDSEILIGGCRFQPLSSLTFFDIQIKKDSVYDFKFKELNIQYALNTLMRGIISKIYLRDAQAEINIPQRRFLEFARFLNLKSQRTFSAEAVELSHLNINLNSSDFILRANVSSDFNLMKPWLNYIELRIDTVNIQGSQLKDAYFKVSQMQPAQDFYIKQIKYERVKIDDLKGKVELKGRTLALDYFSADFLEGKLQGDLKLLIEKNLEYRLNLKVLNLDLATLASYFNLTEKFQMSGSLQGSVRLEGRGMHLSLLQGDFLLPEPGGILNIKDDRFLKDIAQTTQQPLEVVVESFKGYHYNSGKGRLYLQEGNLVLEAILEGEAGRRNFNITLHFLN